jgi:nitrilase
MPTPSSPWLAAVAQPAPVFLDREATVERACQLIAEAGRKGARLIAFPESYIPTYPDWVWAVPAGEEGLLSPLYAEFLANSVEIPGPSTARLAQAAKRAKIHLVMGVSERNVEASGGSLYNTLVYINDQGELLGKHRKLVPTGGERLVWAQGDGSTLDTYDTPLGRLGGLICWENYMPLARYALYAWGVQIYVAATWDRSEPWLSTVRHIAKEGRVYVLSSCMALRKSDIPDRYEFKKRFYPGAEDWINAGDSAIAGPDGELIAGPLHESEGILYAELDPARMTGPRWMLDVAGHYARPDVFQLTVHREKRPMLSATQGLPETGNHSESASTPAGKLSIG